MEHPNKCGEVLSYNANKKRPKFIITNLSEIWQTDSLEQQSDIRGHSAG